MCMLLSHQEMFKLCILYFCYKDGEEAKFQILFFLFFYVHI